MESTPESRAKAGDIAAVAAELVDGVDAAARHRSNSPSGSWAFTVSTKAANRVRSNDGSGVSTPVLSHRYAGAAGARYPSSGANAPARQAAAQSALLTAVRKQMDSLEDKVYGQISKMQLQERGLREAAFKTIEEKMHTTEGAQPRLDRRIAELTGNFKGLSDEMQSQIRRVDAMDERLWEWRKEMEEDFRQKFLDYEQRLTKVSSTSRVMHSSFEDTQKKHSLRLQRIELDAGDRLAAHEETREGLLMIHSRLEALEEDSALRLDQDAAPELVDRRGSPKRSETREQVETNSELLSLFEKRMGDIGEKVARVLQDSSDLHQNSKQQEVQLSSLRTLFDAREEQFRKLVERVEREDIECRLEQFRRKIDEDSRDKVDVLEKLELMGNRLNDQERSYEGLQIRHEQLLQTSVREIQTLDLGATPGADLELSLERGSGGGMEDCLLRLTTTESRLSALDTELASVREAAELGTRLGALVSQLQEIVPKVIEHEQKVNDLRAELDTVARRGVGKEDFSVVLEQSLDSVRGEMNGLAEVLRTQAGQSVQFASDLASMGEELAAQRTDCDGESSLRGEAVTKDDLSALRTSLQVSIEGLLEMKTNVQEVQREVSEALRLEGVSLRREIEEVNTGVQGRLLEHQASFSASTADLERRLAEGMVSSGSVRQPESSVASPELREELMAKAAEEAKRCSVSATLAISKLEQDVKTVTQSLESISRGSVANVASSEAMTRPQVEELTETVRKTLREDLLRELSEEAGRGSRVSSEVSALQSRVDAMRIEFLRERDAGAGERSGGDRSGGPCADLEKAVLQDEEIEREKQQKLLARIDELCLHIAAVDESVVRGGAQVTTLGDGIPAEFAGRFQVLADQVEAQTRRHEDLHQQLTGKFDQLSTIVQQVETISREGK